MSMISLLSRIVLSMPKYTQIRHMRPTLKMNKEKFQITLDVRQFEKEEIKVKARDEYIIIEGRQERQNKQGYVTRHFVKKFKLPKGCSTKMIQSTLTEDGTLTVTAPRSQCDINLPCETTVPITYVQTPGGNGDDPLHIKDIQSKK